MFKFFSKKFLNSKPQIIFVLFIVASSFLIGDVALAGWWDNSVITVLGGIASVVIKVLGWLIGLGIEGVIQIAKYNDFISEDAIVKAWILVRDLCNMFFVFVLLIIAFATILRLESYGVKQLLGKLLLMAILINFSRMICGILIDFSQVIMLTFIDAFNTNGSAFVDGLKVDEILSGAKSIAKDGDEVVKYEDYDLFSVVAGMLMAIFFLGIVAIVMWVLFITLLMRVIMLWVYTILSPLAFLLSTFPAGKKYSDQWWSEFSQNIIVGPVLAFFVWLALSISGTNVITLDLNQAGAGNICIGPWEMLCVGSFMNYIIAVAMLFGGLIVTQQIGGKASEAGMWAKTKGYTAAKYVGKGTLATGKWATTVPRDYAKGAGFTLAERALAAYGGTEKEGTRFTQFLDKRGLGGLKGALGMTWAAKKQAVLKDYREHQEAESTRNLKMMTPDQVINLQRQMEGHSSKDGARGLITSEKDRVYYESILSERMRRNDFIDHEDFNKTTVEAMKAASAYIDYNGNVSYRDTELGDLINKALMVHGGRAQSVHDNDDANTGIGAFLKTFEDKGMLPEQVMGARDKAGKAPTIDPNSREAVGDWTGGEHLVGGYDYARRYWRMVNEPAKILGEKMTSTDVHNAGFKDLRGLRLNKNHPHAKTDTFSYEIFNTLLRKGKLRDLRKMYEDDDLQKQELLREWIKTEGFKKTSLEFGATTAGKKKDKLSYGTDKLEAQFFGVPGAIDKKDKGWLGNRFRKVRNKDGSKSVQAATGLTGMGKIEDGEIDNDKVEKGRIAYDFNKLKGIEGLDQNSAGVRLQGKGKEQAIEAIGNALTMDGVGEDMVQAIKESLGELDSLRLLNSAMPKEEVKTVMAHEALHERVDDTFSQQEKQQIWGSMSKEEQDTARTRINKDWGTDNMSDAEVIDEYIAESLTSETAWAEHSYKEKTDPETGEVTRVKDKKIGMKLNNNARATMEDILIQKGITGDNYNNNPIKQFTSKLTAPKPVTETLDDRPVLERDVQETIVQSVTDPELKSAIDILSQAVQGLGDGLSAIKTVNNRPDVIQEVVQNNGNEAMQLNLALYNNGYKLNQLTKALQEEAAQRELDKVSSKPQAANDNDTESTKKAA